MRGDFKLTPLLAAASVLPVHHRWCGPRAGIETIAFLLDAGADVHATDELDCAALNYAVSSPSWDAAALLIARGANPQRVTKDNYSTMVHASLAPPSADKLHILRHLLALGVSPHAASSYNESPASLNSYVGDFAALRLLFEAGANLEFHGPGPLFRSIAFDSPSDVKRALDATDGSERRDCWERTPLLFAVLTGDTAKARVLLDAGYSLQDCARCGDTALHIASRAGHAGMVAWLLENGADPNGAREFDDTALHAAAEAGSAECAALLLAAGADARRKNHVESEPIHQTSSEAVIRLLVEHGADPNAVDGCGDWPMKSAAQCNDVALGEALCSMGAESDFTNHSGSALHQAIRDDAREFAAWLLARGTDPNAADCDGWTPLFYATSREAIALLRSYGADFDHRDICDGLPDGRWNDPLLHSA